MTSNTITLDQLIQTVCHAIDVGKILEEGVVIDEHKQKHLSDIESKLAEYRMLHSEA